MVIIAVIRTAMEMELARMVVGRCPRTPPVPRVEVGEAAPPRVVALGRIITLLTRIVTTVVRVSIPPALAPLHARIAITGSSLAAMGIQRAHLVPQERMPPSLAALLVPLAVLVSMPPAVAHRVACAAVQASSVAQVPRTAPRAPLVKLPPPAPHLASLTPAPLGNI